MAGASIVINQAGNATPGASGVSRDDLVTGDVVTLSNFNNTGVRSWRWVLKSRPLDSAATLNNSIIPSTEFIPDVPGTYLVELTVNEGLKGEIDSRVVVVRDASGYRVPAAGESDEANYRLPDGSLNDQGYWPDLARLLNVVRTGGGGGSVLRTSNVASLHALVDQASLGSFARLDNGRVWRCTNVGVGSSTWEPTHESVNVLEFGADNTGTTATQAAINAAIALQNARGGGVVYVPRGTYLIDTNYLAGGSVRVLSNVTLHLDPGAVLQAVPTSNGQGTVVWAYNAENIIIQGGYIRGERDGHIGTAQPDGNHGISIFSCDDVTIRGVRVSHCWGDGLYVRNDTGANNTEDTLSTRVRVLDSSFFNNRRTGFACVAVDGLIVSKCFFYGNNGANPFAGINLEPNSDGWVRNCLVIDCISYGNEGAGFQTSGVNIIFAHCIAYSNYNGFQVMDTTGGHGRRVCVIGGQAYDNYRGIRYEDAEDCTFREVYIYDNEQNGAECRVIDQTQILGLTFEGCKFRGNGGLGLYLDSAPGARICVNASDNGLQNIYVINSPGSVLRDCYAYGSATSHNIQIVDSADVRIIGGESSYAAQRNIVVEASAPRCLIQGMCVHHSGFDGIWVLSASCLINGNIVYASSTVTNNTYDNILVGGTGGGCLITNNISLRGSETNQPRYAIRVSAESHVNNILVDNITRDGAGVAGGVSGEISDNGNYSSRTIRATASISFPSINAGEYNDQTASVIGADIGDVVALGPPSGATEWPVGFSVSGFVSATNVVTIRAVNNSGSPADPITATWRIQVSR